MKLLVSDYDGTFDVEYNSLEVKRNKEAVKRFRDNGNLFAFATARNFLSIKSEIDKYSLAYDYLICGSGNAIFNSKDSVVFYSPLCEEAIIKTMKYLTALPYIKSINLYDVYGQKATRYYEVSEITCTVSLLGIKSINEIKRELDFLRTNSFLNIVFIKEKCDKKEGVDRIISEEKISESDVYTIGNASQDKNMLTSFNGFKMPLSSPILHKEKITSTTSVHSLVKKIERI